MKFFILPVYLALQGKRGRSGRAVTETGSKNRSQLLKGVLEGCVLALLAREEIYGYELSMKLAAHGLLFVREGSIYPVLLRLEKERLIVGTLKASDSGPPRKYYRLTEEGKQALAVFQAEWTEMKTAVERILRQGGMSDGAERETAVGG